MRIAKVGHISSAKRFTKKKNAGNRLGAPSLLPLDSLLLRGALSTPNLLKFPSFSTSSQSEAALQAAVLPLFTFLMKVGGWTRRAEIHKHMYRLPLKQAWVNLVVCAQASALLQRETGGHCSEVEEQKTPHEVIDTNTLPMSCQLSSHC